MHSHGGEHGHKHALSIWQERLKALASRKNKLCGVRGSALQQGSRLKQVC